MTTDPWADLDAPNRREIATFRLVQLAAWVAFVLADLGAVLAVSGRMEYADGRVRVGLTLLVAAAVLAIGCLHHGIRNMHERGRLVAGLALFVALVALVIVGADMVIELRFYSREIPHPEL